MLERFADSMNESVWTFCSKTDILTRELVISQDATMS